MIPNFIISNNNYLWIIIPLFLWFFIGFCFVFYKQRALLFNIVHPDNLKIIFPSNQTRSRILQISLFFLALIFLFITTLRIQWGDEKITIDQGGRNILFAVDISRSMLATDVSKNNTLSRLDFAKIKIRSLVEKIGPERIGLLLFADKHLLQCPFTKDFRNFFSFLDQLDNLVVSSSATTQIASAFLGAVDVFNQAKVKSKILIILTDGEDFGEASMTIFERAKKENIALFAFGIGSTTGAPIPILDPLGKIIGYEKDKNGKFILTKLNFPKLSEIVSFLGGQSQVASFNESDILSAKSFIEKNEKEKFNDVSFVLRKESYPYFATASCLFFVLETLTRIL